MRSFARSVLTGFAFSLGAAVFRKIAPKLGLDDKNGKKDAEKVQASDADRAAGDGDGGDGGKRDRIDPAPASA